MRLLIYEPSYRRVRERIDGLPGLELLIMDETGAIRRDGQVIELDEARPQAGWVNADVFFGPAARAYSGALLKSPDLAWAQSGAAGFDNKLFVQIVEKGAILTTSHGQAVGMADYVLWGVLDHLQRGPQRRAAQAAHDWTRTPFREIAGSRWLIIGFGAIGQGVAERARAFGAAITGVRRSGDAHPAAERMGRFDDIPALLPEADVVVLCCPLSAETRHMANAAFFAAMKPRSILANVGRGELVDEPALLAALDKGVPEHAVLDVFAQEPLPADSPFWDHPRVALTPHSSGMSAGNAPRNDALFIDNLKRRLAGEPLLNIARAEEVLAG
jgi:phosphoglycerate dehydrogenase-like enzyme